MWRQVDDKETTAETDNKPPEPKETKEGEREDLIARFDRVVHGESDGNSQVQIDSRKFSEIQQRCT